MVFRFEFWSFEFVSDFVLRISDLPDILHPASCIQFSQPVTRNPQHYFAPNPLRRNMHGDE